MSKLQNEFVYIFNDDTGKNNKTIVYRDKEIFNRFWFEYPPEWRTANVKDRYIGFRSFYVSKIYRHLQFDLEITIRDESFLNPENVITVPVHNRIRYEEYLTTLYFDLRNCVKEYLELHKDEYINMPVPEWNKIRMDRDFTKEDGITKYCNKLFYEDDDVDITFAILNPNSDAKAILNINGDVSSRRIVYFNNLWDRHSILLQSNIAVNNSKNYLGFTNKNYNPIKYYKINSQDTKFYIDLYHGHYQNIPVNLPNDEKEQIILEIVIPED